MLESMYIILSISSFVCLILAVSIGNKESTKLISKVLLSGIAMVIFSVLAIDSANIEISFCDAISCSTQHLFFGEYGYIFWTMGIISAFLMFAYTILIILDIYKNTPFMDRFNKNLM